MVHHHFHLVLSYSLFVSCPCRRSQLPATPFRLCLSRHPAFKHSLPVAFPCRQSEHTIQSHVVYQHARILALAHSQSAAHLLQIFCQRQGRAAHLHKLHVRTVEALAEHVNVHHNLYPSCLKVVHQGFTCRPRRLAVYRHRLHAPSAVVFRNVSGVFNAYGVHNALFAVGIAFHGVIQPFDARLPVQLLVHLLYLVVAVGSPSLQFVYQSLFLALTSYRHIVEHRQIAASYKLRNAPSRYQLVKQIRKTLAVHSAWRGRHSQLLSLRVSSPQFGVSVSQRMVSFVYHYHTRHLVLHVLPVSRQPLYRQHVDLTGVRQLRIDN